MASRGDRAGAGLPKISLAGCMEVVHGLLAAERHRALLNSLCIERQEETKSPTKEDAWWAHTSWTAICSRHMYTGGQGCMYLGWCAAKVRVCQHHAVDAGVPGS